MTVDGSHYDFEAPHVSEFGAYGLQWGMLKPQEMFGKVADISFRPRVQRQDADRDYRCEAIITRERSFHNQYMGLKFQLDERQRTELRQTIERSGYYPTDYMRKYPRIPAHAGLQTFPLKAIVSCEATTELNKNGIQGQETVVSNPIVFDVLNLSPNGILISTENPMSHSFEPGDRLNMILDPRGWFPIQIKVKGLICRVIEDRNPKSHNIQRHFGIKFIQVDPENRNAFLELLRDILEQIKHTAL